MKIKLALFTIFICFVILLTGDRLLARLRGALLNNAAMLDVLDKTANLETACSLHEAPPVDLNRSGRIIQWTQTAYPQVDSIWRNVQLINFLAGRPSSTVETLRSAPHHLTSDQFFLLWSGLAAYRYDDDGDVAATLRKLLVDGAKTNADTRKIYQALAAYYGTHCDNYLLARFWLELVLEADSGDIEAWIQFLSLDLSFSQWDRIIETAPAVISLATEDPRAYAILSRAHLGLGHLNEAITNMEQALRLEPTQAEYWRALCELIGYSSDLKRAAALCLRAVELAPQSFGAHFWLGKTYAGMERHEMAIEQYQIASKLAPWEPNYHYEAAVEYLALHRCTDAYLEAERARALGLAEDNYVALKERLASCMEGIV